MAKNVQLTIDIKGNDSVGKAAEKTTSLRTELKKLKQELASGNLVGKAFDDAATKAGQLEDAIKDVNQRVNNLSSDTQKLDGFLDLAQGITGGFAAAQGAMALFGSENEDLQKQLVKIQGAVALLNGVQQVANTLNKDSAAMTQLNTIRTKILTFVEKERALAVEAGGNAMQRAAVKARMFGIALGALGIGALIAGIIYLIANFDKLTAAFDKTTLSQKALKETQEAYSNAAKDAQFEVNKMASTFNLARKGLVDKQKALLEYNEKFGKTLGIAKDYNEAEKIFADKSAAYIKAVSLRAQANALYEKSAESTVKQIDALNEDNISATDKLLLGIKTSVFGVKNTIDDVTKAQKKGTDEVVNQEKAKQKAYQQTADSLMQMSLELENQNNIDLSGVEDKEAAKKRKEERDREKKEYEQNKKEALKRADDNIKEQIKRFQDDQAKLKEARLEAEFALEDEKDQQAQKERERAEQLSQEIIDANQQVQDAKIQAVQVGSQILSQFAGQNKALATAALAIEKGAAIADVVIKGIRERAAITLKYAAVPGGQAAAAPELLASKIRTGISVASIAAAGIQGARSIGSGGSGGGSVQPPNIRGSQTTNEQPTPQPTKVFVTETDIRSVTRKVDGIYTQATIQ